MNFIFMKDHANSVLLLPVDCLLSLFLLYLPMLYCRNLLMSEYRHSIM